MLYLSPPTDVREVRVPLAARAPILFRLRLFLLPASFPASQEFTQKQTTGNSWRDDSRNAPAGMLALEDRLICEGWWKEEGEEALTSGIVNEQEGVRNLCSIRGFSKA